MKLSPMKKSLRERLDVLLYVLLVVALGVLLIVFPEISGSAVVCVLGVCLCAFGALHIIRYFTRDAYEVMRKQELTLGLAALAAGAAVLIAPGLLVATVSVMLGCVLLLGGIFKVQWSLDMKRMGFSRWYLTLAGALISAILGVLALVNPFGVAAALMRFVGVSLVVEGIMDGVAYWLLRDQRNAFYPDRE